MTASLEPLQEIVSKDSRKWAVLMHVREERRRQDAKWGWPNNGLAGDDPGRKLGILMEEVGEVATAIIEHEPIENLKKELLQVAAVAVAWVESIEESGR